MGSNSEINDNLDEGSDKNDETVKTDLPASYFVDLLEKYGSSLLSKSNLPCALNERNSALDKMAECISNDKGITFTRKQLTTKFYNFKARTKKKADINRTGNEPISLSDAERRLWTFLSANDNPALTKVKCNL